MGRARTRASTQALRLTVVVLVPWCFSSVVQCLTLTIDRATAYTLLFDVSCDTCEEDSFVWEYKTSPEEEWGEPPRLFNHLINPNAYYVAGLKENTLYYIRVKHSPTGEYSNKIEVWTCEKVPPPVTQLRVASAGPGWLDIRWTPPQEKCKSLYYYDVRYMPLGGDFSPTKRFGYLDLSHSKAYVRPFHPCSGKDFCVLLTDRVVAGYSHQIELKVERIGGDNEISETFRLTGIATTDDTGLHGADDVVCSDRKKQQGISSYEEENELNNLQDHKEMSQSGIVLEMWVLILLGILFLIAFSAIVGLWIKYSFTKTSSDREKKIDEIELPPAEYMEERYVDPREMAEHCKKSEYEEELYEEINIQDDAQSKL